MFDFINGKVEEILVDSIVVENNAVGYRLFTSYNTMSSVKIGDENRFYVKMLVKQDDISLVGFSTREERQMFEILTSVSGVGTKAGLSILSTLTLYDIQVAVLNGDDKTISKTKGIGKKTAQRIILEIKDKIDKSISSSSAGVVMTAPVSNLVGGSITNDAVEALGTLGYSKSEAQEVVNSVISEDSTLEDIIRDSLKLLNRLV
jgi:Holliday junction DNA helicase RuvA